MPILPCVFCTFNWLTLTSEMYFVRFHPEVTSCLLSRGKTKYATMGMRLWCKYIRNYLLVYQLTSHFLPYLRNYKEFEGEISDLQLEKYGLSFETKKYTTSIWARGDENVIGIRAFKRSALDFRLWFTKPLEPQLQFLWNKKQKKDQVQLLLLGIINEYPQYKHYKVEHYLNAVTLRFLKNWEILFWLLPWKYTLTKCASIHKVWKKSCFPCLPEFPGIKFYLISISSIALYFCSV